MRKRNVYHITLNTTLSLIKKSGIIQSHMSSGRILVAGNRHFALKRTLDYLLRWLDTLPSLPPQI